MSAYVLPAELYAPQDILEAIDALKAAVREMEQAEVRALVAQAPEAAPAPLPEESITALKRFGLTGTAGRGEIEPLLAWLEELLSAAPQLHITLAAMPSEGLKKKLVAWVRAELSPSALVTFGYNSALLGGMVVRTGSRIFDLSFRRQLLGGGGKFAEALRRV